MYNQVYGRNLLSLKISKSLVYKLSFLCYLIFRFHKKYYELFFFNQILKIIARTIFSFLKIYH